MRRCITLVNKIKDKINRFISGDSKKIKIIIAIGLVGMILILASEIFSSNTAESKKNNDNFSFNYTEYTAELEKKLVDVISVIDGVGECNVMITLENSSENVYATNNENKSDNNSYNRKDEYVFYDSDNGKNPVLIKEYLPKVQGVTVVCSGGDDIAVKEKIIESVTALFNISTNRVSVSKIKS